MTVVVKGATAIAIPIPSTTIAGKETGPVTGSGARPDEKRESYPGDNWPDD